MKITNNNAYGRGSNKWMMPARQKVKQDSIPAALESEYIALARYMVSKGAKTLSARGASKGGHARAAALTDQQRTDIASKAATARWTKTKENNGIRSQQSEQL